jgi:hypothetical protein
MSDSLDKISDVASSDGNISKEEKKLFGDEKRGEIFKTNIHIIVIFFMYFIALSFACMIFVRSWDFIVADKYHWLTEREDHDLERLIFSGIIVSFATKYFKKFNIIES